MLSVMRVLVIHLQPQYGSSVVGYLCYFFDVILTVHHC